MASLLMFLIAILLSSAYFEANLAISFLLSSVKSGIGSLIKVPSVIGFKPKFDDVIELSTELTKAASHI